MIVIGCAIGPSDDLEEMPIRILEVHAATAVIVVDLARATLARVGPIVDAALADPGKYLIELSFSDQEGVMLRHYLVLRLIEIKTHAVAQRDYPERAEAGSVGQPKNFGEKVRRRLLVTRHYDGVIELYSHVVLLLYL
jgi:hypothetical protein